MTQDEIIAMAREAGIWVLDTGEPYDGLSAANFERFAALVAAKEREACAQVCSDRSMRCESEALLAIENGELDGVSAIRSTAWQISVCASEIRARSKP